MIFGGEHNEYGTSFLVLLDSKACMGFDLPCSLAEDRDTFFGSYYDKVEAILDELLLQHVREIYIPYVPLYE